MARVWHRRAPHQLRCHRVTDDTVAGSYRQVGQVRRQLQFIAIELGYADVIDIGISRTQGARSLELVYSLATVRPTTLNPLTIYCWAHDFGRRDPQSSEHVQGSWRNVYSKKLRQLRDHIVWDILPTHSADE